MICADEFAMAHDAFALLPISARAARPSDADYEAIREAFMETARGRWFLGEYAKRNRNADTRMVLDAMARVEQTLEAMQQPPDTHLPEILTILRNEVDQAAKLAASAVEGLAIEERLAAIRQGARILTEISWRWWETESRICDSIEAQVCAIQQSCGQLDEIDIRAALTAAFDLIRTRIEAFAEDDSKAVPPTADAVTKPDLAAAAMQVVTEDDALASPIMAAAPDEAVSSRETDVTAISPSPWSELPDVAMTTSERAETANVRDRAPLGIGAIEPTTLAGTDRPFWRDALDRYWTEPAGSESAIVAEQVEPTPTQAGTDVLPPWMQPEPLAVPLRQLYPSPVSTAFTGESPEQRRADTDPSSAISRMSLTEKIEFFS